MNDLLGEMHTQHVGALGLLPLDNVVSQDIDDTLGMGNSLDSFL